MLLAVHDEIIGECPKENIQEVIKMKEKLMIEACKDKITIPIGVDTEVTERWYGSPLKVF